MHDKQGWIDKERYIYNSIKQVNHIDKKSLLWKVLFVVKEKGVWCARCKLIWVHIEKGGWLWGMIRSSSLVMYLWSGWMFFFGLVTDGAIMGVDRQHTWGSLTLHKIWLYKGLIYCTYLYGKRTICKDSIQVACICAGKP